MAVQQHIISVPGIANAALAQAAVGAAGKISGINLLMMTLADWMKEIHGGTCRIHIDHEHAMAMVVVDRDEQIKKPRRGEVV